MVRHVTTAAGLTDAQLFAARGDWKVLLETTDAGSALREATSPYINWDTVENCDALDLGVFTLLALWGTTFDSDVDSAVFDEEMVGIACLARLWGSKLQNGMTFVPDMAQAQLLNTIKQAAVRAGKDAMTIKRADLVRTEARPANPTAPTVPAGRAAGRGRGGGRGRGRGAPAPPAPVAGPTLATFWDVVEHLHYAELIRTDRDSSTVALLEYDLHCRATTALRQPPTECGRAWTALIKAVDGGDSGSESKMVGLVDEDNAIVFAEAILARQLPDAFLTMKASNAHRRRDATRAIQLKGKPDAAMVTALLPEALRSGELPFLAEFMRGETVPARLCVHVTVIALALKEKVTQAAFGEQMVRAVERALAADNLNADGATPEARIANLETHLKERKTAGDNAPRTEGSEGVAGAMALVSHTKAQQDALFAVYATDNFRGQQAAIERMQDASGMLYLALTGSFLGAVGTPAGPVDKAEETKAKSWTPIPVLHQLVWGKVQSLQGKESLRKLAINRIHMPKLLGELASRMLQGVDSAGEERMANLKLDAFWEQLKYSTWKHKLRFVNDLLVPVLCAFHDMDLKLQPPLPPAACYDPQMLRLVAPLLSGVMVLCNVPLTGAHSIKGWLAPVERILALHAPGATAAQAAMLQQATATYIEESLEEFVTRFNQARFEADATAKLDATLGDGEALGQLNQTLRSFNNTASRKRAAEGAADGGVTVLKLPRTSFGVAAGPLAAHITSAAVSGAAAATKNVSFAGVSTDGAQGKGRQGDPPKIDLRPGDVAFQASEGYRFNETLAREKLKELGAKDRCYKALLCGSIQKEDFLKKCTERACTLTGTGQHMGCGAKGTGKHAPVKGFNCLEFRLKDGQ